jgi:hypothetical protein
LVSLSLLFASRVRADDALFLNWDICGPSGSSQEVFDCSSNDGSEVLYCSFTLAQPLDQVVGVEVVVDVSHSEDPLPAWWQMGPGGCRFGDLSADGDPPSGTDCGDFWAGKWAGGLQGYLVGQPRGGTNQARIKVALSLLPADARTLSAGTLYDAARIVFGNQSTTGAGSCSGCGLDACLVLNSIWIKRLPGAPGGDVFLENPGAGGNLATWQGTGADCSAVPVHTASWGKIKALYR